MKKILLLLTTLCLLNSFIFASDEDEQVVESYMGNEVWDVVEFEGQTLPVGSFQFTSFEDNEIEASIFLRGLTVTFVYDTVDQYNNERYLVNALSETDSRSMEVSLMFDFRNYPESVIVQEYLYDEVINTFNLIKSSYEGEDFSSNDEIDTSAEENSLMNRYIIKE